MKKEQEIKFSFKLKDYPIEALYMAAYAFLSKAYVFLDSTKTKINIFLKGKKRLSDKKLEELKGEFLNELLNCTVRINVSKKNQKIRKCIVGQALVSAVGLAEAEQEVETKSCSSCIGYEDDPLGIAIPWEEKYATKKDKSGPCPESSVHQSIVAGYS